jgi:hypothetical protein
MPVQCVSAANVDLSAHRRWNAALGRDSFRDLLRQKKFDVIGDTAIRIGDPPS